ncbi:MAG: cell division protein FtsQ/DivIB [Amphiplicatus sp.]
MPKVKRKKAPARRKASAASSKGPSWFERLADLAQRYALASVAGVLVILAGVGAVLWAGGYVGLLAERLDRAASNGAVAAGFAIRKVTVKGRHQAALDEIGAAIGPVIGASLLHFDAERARARVEELGWVRAAAVTRLLPDTIHVSIRERAPSAVWQMSGAFHLIDVNGAVIREIGAYEYSSLPLIVGAGAPEAAADILAALEAHPDIKEKTSALVRVGERRWNMRLRNNLDVKLPEAGFADALEALAILNAAHGTLDQDLEYIDLRDPERLVVRKRGERAAE